MNSSDFGVFGFLFGGAPGVWELLIVAVILLLLFGGRLPSVMRNLGRGVTEFKKGISGTEDDAEDEKSSDTPKERLES